jgi:glutathione S-transferase
MAPGDRTAKLYVILGSHACKSGMLMLQHKRIPFRVVTLPTGMQRMMPAFGFPQDTVPALEIAGRSAQTNAAMARLLDEIQPDPPLFPTDEGHRREVEEAERWGDEEFQMAARRIALAGTLHGPDALTGRGADGPLGPLLWRSDRARWIGTRMLCKFIFDVNPHTERELLDDLPRQLDRIDGWIDAGVLGGERLNAADYMIASSLTLILYRHDMQPLVEPRPAGWLARRLLPQPTG